ncbi:glutamate decarboxylase [Corynebacterium sp. TAE3-ERU16]|uniref:glutamate decarboxylase n=1 Tax=Corynebacterium sp. TAE3-ERU16 TaxID=2849493 RepID=UPI001C488684|nr:glutamate decarboxylase [Corynebacterium sp. TAE3-ERU16]MBV7293659.1 glutamate decarboxylase [Corynebacterium sp. TAE3-ERU16]
MADNDDHDDRTVTPAYAGRFGAGEVPSHRLPDDPMDPDATYRLIHDEMMLDGNARLNLATFVTTWMEPQAEKLMAEAFDKNSIDKDEYPSTSRIEERCVAIISDLFHGPTGTGAIGTSSIGSSEAVMLAGLAMKWRWRARRAAQLGVDPGDVTERPTLVLGTNVQVVWEKFCRYFDVTPRYVSMSPGDYCVKPDEVAAACDGTTIGAVAILGTTYTGEYEDVVGICAALDSLAAAGGPDVPVHVDAASGGFVAPFLDPDLEWDFRQSRVVSINVSGHKFGLTYPGIGFCVWRGAEHLPEELVFHVDYLGGDMPTFTLNFSRPGNQIVGQYYNLLRLGRRGYTEVMTALRDTATWLARELGGDSAAEVVSDGSAIPVLTWRYRDVSAYQVSHELRCDGWQVPAYPPPEGAEQDPILRVVVREGFSRDMAESFLDSVDRALGRIRDAGPVSGERSFAH